MTSAAFALNVDPPSNAMDAIGSINLPTHVKQVVKSHDASSSCIYPPYTRFRMAGQRSSSKGRVATFLEYFQCQLGFDGVDDAPYCRCNIDKASILGVATSGKSDPIALREMAAWKHRPCFLRPFGHDPPLLRPVLSLYSVPDQRLLLVGAE
jgi:hypothetical protein